MLLYDKQSNGLVSNLVGPPMCIIKKTKKKKEFDIYEFLNISKFKLDSLTL